MTESGKSEVEALREERDELRAVVRRLGSRLALAVPLADQMEHRVSAVPQDFNRHERAMVEAWSAYKRGSAGVALAMCEITLSPAYRWGSDSGPGPCSSPLSDVRALVVGSEGPIDHFEMNQATACVFLSHPDVSRRLSLVESEHAPGTAGGEFLFRGFGRFLVRNTRADGVLVAIGSDGRVVGRIVQ